jgi:twitching motility protein PilT
MSSGESSPSKPSSGSTVQIDRLLDVMVKQDASDLHITVGRPPTVRLNGRLRNLQTKILDPDDTMALMKSITPEKNQAEFQEVGGTDFGFSFSEAARFRVSVFRQKTFVAMVLRLIPNRLLSFEQIGLPPISRELIKRPRGLFLVTGPTGSGKTTTIATMVDYVNSNFEKHIVTVEDPIEYYHVHKRSIVNQREVGSLSDVPSFAEALRRALRQNPDVILVGEMRDLETIEAAIKAAETGHLVFGTLHTTGAAGTINRIIDAFPVNQQEQVRVQLSTSLLAVLSQVLLARSDKPGRIAGYEFMVVTPAISNLIRESKTFRIDSAIQTGKKFGMQLLDEHLWSIFSKGMITAEEMVENSRNPDDLKDRIRKAGGTVPGMEFDGPSETIS